MNWLHYLAEANVYLCIFYLCYRLFLSRETHYTLNRMYLLFSCVLSFMLPFIQLGILKPAQKINLDMTNMMINAQYAVNQSDHIAAPAHQFTWQDGLLYSYLLGVVVFMVLLILKLYQLLALTKRHQVTIKNGYKLVNIDQPNTAFSFFNYLFIGSDTGQTSTIIRHELVHIRQKHSLDIVLLELFKIVNWFNPFVYLLQNSLKAVHEYIADQQTAPTQKDVPAYSDFLVNNAYGITGPLITHSFFNYNLLKNRIIMLHQKPSGSLARLKYLVIVPLCTALLCASTLAFSKTYGWIDLAPARKPAAIVKTKLLPKDTINFRPHYTSKGFKVEQMMRVANSKPDLRVTLTDKNGQKKSFDKSTATTADIKLLNEKYGYTFPSDKAIAAFPPPPPPMLKPGPPAGKRIPPPPPPAPPKHDKQVKFSKPAPNFYVAGQDTVYLSCDKVPEFPGGSQSFYKYLGKNIKYPAVAREKKIQGKVILQFIVQKDGSVSNVKVVRKVSPEIDEEAVRVLAASPKWEAGTNKGSPVICEYNVPVSFTLAR